MADENCQVSVLNIFCPVKFYSSTLGWALCVRNLLNMGPATLFAHIVLLFFFF